MAARDRADRGFQGSDSLDDYLRNEYRAEQGAYLERRPAYADYGNRDRDARFWAPRRPTSFYLDEEIARSGTGAPLGEPLYRDDEPLYRNAGAPEYSARNNRYFEEGREYRGHLRHRPKDRARYSRELWRQDLEAGRGLLHAAEEFYEDLSEDVGLSPHEGAVSHHRGRGPGNYRRSDERILDEVSQRLTDDAHIDASDIEVTVKDQEVTLSGTVATRFDKRHAEDIADAVSGVTHVQNNLRIRPDSALR